MRKIKVLVALLAVAVWPDQQSSAQRAAANYCGVRCVHAAARAVGREIPVSELLKPEYVGSVRGSTIAELQRSARDHGLAAEPVSGFSLDGLRGLNSPMILHVRGDGFHAGHNHWVLYTGSHGGAVTILDPSSGEEAMELADLAARWDGSGLIIADSDTAVDICRFSSSVISISHVLLIGTLCVVLLAATTFVRRLWGPVGAAGSILAVACLAAVGWHSLLPQGYLRNPAAVASVRCNRVRIDIPRVGADDLKALLKDPQVRVVDARPENAYDAGHIEGALSLPIHSGREERDRLFAQLPRGGRVVLYCQGPKCPWAEVVAGDLASRGHDALYIFPGGWDEWSANVTHR